MATRRTFLPPPKRCNEPRSDRCGSIYPRAQNRCGDLRNINHKRPTFPARAAGLAMAGPVGASMSQWSAYQSPRTSRAPQQARDVARKAEPRPHAAKPPAVAKTSGYTIAHAGRQIRFGPVAFWIAVGSVVILAGWWVTPASYFAFSADGWKGLI